MEAVFPPFSVVLDGAEERLSDGGTMRALRCLLALVLLFPRAAPARCPRPCTCPQLEELHCTFRSLLSVPGGLPVELRRINLGSVRGGPVEFLFQIQ